MDHHNEIRAGKKALQSPTFSTFITLRCSYTVGMERCCPPVAVCCTVPPFHAVTIEYFGLMENISPLRDCLPVMDE